MIWNYQSILADLKAKLALMPKWNNVLYYGVYERLIDVVAYILEKMAYTADILVSSTSWLKNSILKQQNIMSKIFSYNAYRKKGANGLVIASADDTFSDVYSYTGLTVFIPKWTRFTDTGGSINTYAIDNYSYSSGQVGNIEVQVREGVPKTFTYVALGTANESFSIYSDSIDNDILDIYIVDNFGNVLYTVTQNENLYFVNDLINYNCSTTTFDDFQGVTFTFGDGITVKKLNTGDRILVKYADTKGDLGNISSANTIVVIKDIIFDSSSTAATLYITNTEAITDGTTYEDIESIRNNASNLFFAGYRCGTKNDWKHIIESFSFVYKAVVWTITDVGGSTLLSEQNKVFISAISILGDNITTAQQSYLSTQLDESFKSPTEIIQYENATKVFVKFDVTAKVQNKTNPVILQDIRDLLYNTYATINTDFQINIYSSNYIKLIDTLPEMVYHETTIKLLDYNATPVTSDQQISVYYDPAVLQDQILLVQDSMEIWLKRKIAGIWQDIVQIGYTDTDHVTILGKNGYTIISSLINYTNDTYSFIIVEIANDNGTIYGVRNPSDTDPLGYILAVAYNTKDGEGKQIQNIRLPYRQFITDIDKSFVNAELTSS